MKKLPLLICLTFLNCINGFGRELEIHTDGFRAEVTLKSGNVKFSQPTFKFFEYDAGNERTGMEIPYSISYQSGDALCQLLGYRSGASNISGASGGIKLPNAFVIIKEGKPFYLDGKDAAAYRASPRQFGADQILDEVICNNP